MKIVHRVAFSASDQQLTEIRSLGIIPKMEDSPVTNKLLSKWLWFDIDETDSAWPKLSAMLEEWDISTFPGTIFSGGELKEATSLRMAPSWHHGYPMPDGDFGYLTATYDLTDYCAKCGIGKRQIAPFRMKGEPRWGKRQLLQLNWVFDEFFVRPEVWEHVFQPFGVGCRPVVAHRSGRELQTVVQIDITAIATSTLRIAENQPADVCTRCDRRKYLPISRGPFPSLVEEPAEPMFKTQEYFGSGASAWRAVIVSSALFQAVKEHKVSGVDFIPCVSP